MGISMPKINEYSALHMPEYLHRGRDTHVQASTARDGDTECLWYRRTNPAAPAVTSGVASKPTVTSITPIASELATTATTAHAPSTLAILATRRPMVVGTTVPANNALDHDRTSAAAASGSWFR